jgi:HAD superfamily hydrolase (TIGR01509 family)
MSDRLRGVLLDVDGTLVNSNDAHARAWVDALGEESITVDFARVRPLIGMGGDKLLPALAGLDEDSPTGQRVSQRRAELFRERYLPNIHAFPRVRELLLRLQGAGLSLAVASSAKREELGPLLELAHVADLIEDATSSADADSSKPDPDIVAAALHKLGVGAKHAIMIGDTPYDIEAAARAGIPCIALRSGGRSEADLAGAVAIYADAADLLARFESSPLHGGATVPSR